MLLDSVSSEVEERRKVHKSTKVLFFLGTPHRSNGRAALGGLGTGLDATTVIADPFRLQQINRQPLMRVQVEFGELVYQRTFKTKTFQEREPSKSFLWRKSKVCLILLKASRRGD